MNRTFVVINLFAGVKWAAVVTDEDGENLVWSDESEAARWAQANLEEFSVIELFSW